MNAIESNDELRDLLEPGDYLFHAHEICPHIWQLIEDAGVFGYINFSAARRQILSCEQCKADLFRLLEENIAKADLPGPVQFMISQFVESAKQKLAS